MYFVIQLEPQTWLLIFVSVFLQADFFSWTVFSSCHHPSTSSLQPRVTFLLDGSWSWPQEMQPVPPALSVPPPQSPVSCSSHSEFITSRTSWANPLDPCLCTYCTLGLACCFPSFQTCLSFRTYISCSLCSSLQSQAQILLPLYSCSTMSDLYVALPLYHGEFHSKLNPLVFSM